jgi:hypothetical protein
MNRRAVAIAFSLTIGAASAALVVTACKKERVTEHPEDPLTSPSSTSSATPESCNALYESARAALTAALPTSRPCQNDTDCALVDLAVCTGGCGGAAVPKDAVGAFDAKRKTVESTTCKVYADADCPRITPRPMASCAPPTAVCKDGACDLLPYGAARVGGSGSTGTPGSPACGNNTSDWCTTAADGPCGAHPDEKSCRADASCKGLRYRGKSFVPCGADGKGFWNNCPAVGCLAK